jgi:multidrug efflux system membrane fusion protein
MGVKVAFQEAGGPVSNNNAGNSAGVLVPQAAVSESNGKQYVLLVADNLVERRAISTAGERGKDILVSSGLTSGDKVIINAPSGLKNGDRVKETNE